MDCPSSIINLRREKPVYQQIEALLRSDIESGVLSHGALLPSVQALAEQYQTSVFTIQSALNLLSNDGLIERTRGRGTFITSNRKTLNNVGIYFGSDIWRGKEMAFYQGLYEELLGELGCRKVRHRLWVDTRPASIQGKPLPELVKAVSQNALQGLIIGISNLAEMSWLTNLGLPLALSGSHPLAARVRMDTDQLFERALGDLRDHGCRTVGMITAMEAKPKGETSSGDQEAYYHSFWRHVKAYGLTTRNSWVRTPPRLLLNQEHQEFGYREFHEIWSQPERPDGLFVFPDTVVEGTIKAILQKSVAVPEDLKLVFHRNRVSSVFCPVEASWVVTETASFAKALINLVERQLAGQEVEPIQVPFGFEKSLLQNSILGNVSSAVDSEIGISPG